MSTSTITGRYRLEPLTAEPPARWDELVQEYPGAELFHRTTWLDYLAASQGADVRRWAIHQDEAVVGYFCAGIVQRGPFRILGSPLKSWGTNAMGPLVGDDVDQAGLLRALDALAR
jgi:hypothetical protein